MVLSMLKNGEYIYLFELVIIILNDKDNLNIYFPFKEQNRFVWWSSENYTFAKFKKNYVWERVYDCGMNIILKIAF